MAAVQGEPLIDAHEHRLTASGETSVLIMQWLRQQFPGSKQPRQGFQNPDGAQDAVKRVLQCQVPLADFCTRGAQGQGSQSGAKSGGRQEPPRILSGSWIHAAFSAAVRSGETEFEPSVPVWHFRFQDRCRHDAFGHLNIPRNNRALDLSPAGRNHGKTLVDHHSGVIF